MKSISKKSYIINKIDTELRNQDEKSEKLMWKDK